MPLNSQPGAAPNRVSVCGEAIPDRPSRGYEAMARRRFQSPKPFKEGQFWWLRIWDTNLAGSRKRERIKLAPVDMPLREVQKIAEEKLRPVNQGLVLTGPAMNFNDFVTGAYIPTYLRCFRAARRIHTKACSQSTWSTWSQDFRLSACETLPGSRYSSISLAWPARCRIPQSRRSGIRCLPSSALRSMWTI
jgi:hypothetical protein